MTAKSKKPGRTATLIQTLVYYDEPQLVLLESDRGYNVLAVAVPHDQLSHAYFACEVRDKTFNRYMQGKADLHFVFTDAMWHKYFLLDLLDEGSDIFAMTPLSREEAADPSYWPLPGAFSRSHTQPYLGMAEQVATTKTLKIDGTWGANDFSHFYGKTANLYAVFATLARMEKHADERERSYLRNSIQTRMWRGGGSYVGFYDDLFEHVQALSPLEIARISYASPGELVLRGDQEIFPKIDRVIESIGEYGSELEKRYDNLHGTLAREKLLSASRGSRFSTPQLARAMREQTEVFAKRLGLEEVGEIYDACQRNTVVFLKVVLSIYRRARDLQLFHAEGRITG